MAPGSCDSATLETWLSLVLDEVRLAAAERREVERQPSIEARPPAPDRLLEVGLNRDSLPVTAHR